MRPEVHGQLTERFGTGLHLRQSLHTSEQLAFRKHICQTIRTKQESVAALDRDCCHRRPITNLRAAEIPPEDVSELVLFRFFSADGPGRDERLCQGVVHGYLLDLRTTEEIATAVSDTCNQYFIPLLPTCQDGRCATPEFFILPANRENLLIRTEKRISDKVFDRCRVNCRG